MRIAALFLLVLSMSACVAEEGPAAVPAALYPAGFFWQEEFDIREDEEEGTISLAGEFTATGIDTAANAKQGRQVTKIIAPSHFAAFNKTGYVAQTLLQIYLDSGEDNGVPVKYPIGLPWIGERLFVETDDWLLELPVYGSRSFIATGNNISSYYDTTPSGDIDITKGQALFPLHPEVGGVYTSDMATVYEAVGLETVFDRPTTKLTRKYAPQIRKLATFYSDCFDEDVYFGEKQVRIKSSCEELLDGYWGVRFTPVQESAIWVGENLRLKSVSSVETTTVRQLCCGEGLGETCNSFYWNYSQTLYFEGCSATDELYFKGSRYLSTQEYKVTHVGKDADPKSQPKLQSGGL